MTVPSLSPFFAAPSRGEAAGPLGCWRNDLRAARALRDAAGRARGRKGSASFSRLVELVAEEGILAGVAPGGRIPERFAYRVERLAAARVARVLRERPDAEARARKAAASRSPEIGEVLVERGLAVVSGGPDPGFARRVGRALELLGRAWPEAGRSVRRRVWRVVPVTAWATVSYSSPREPGVAYIDVASAPLVRLAEDLLHESVHMRLHEIESKRELVTRAAREASGSEPRFYSPWRREWRPLRGLVHAVCTFAAGAVFFERMLAASEGGTGAIALPGARRRWLARRLLEERASVGIALGILARGGAARLLAPAGRRLVDEARAAQRALRGAGASRAAMLARDAGGRRELAKVERLVASLRARPVRWGWSSGHGGLEG